ncbi:MAG: winged helix-turn-helix domain-containing protein [Pyrinomonadaceae bacterium]
MSCEKVSIFFPDLFEAEMGHHRTYRFKSFLLDVGERQLFDGVKKVALTPKTFDVLVHLVENAGRLVHKDDLMRAVWPDSFVEEVNVPRSIHHLRKVLGQDKNGNCFIETVPTKGYRFVADVSAVASRSAEGHRIGSDDAIGESAGPSRLRSGGRLYLTGSLIALSALTGAWYLDIWSTPLSPITSSSDHSQNGQAYNHYRQGRLLIDRKLPNDRDAALAEFEKAIELDPKYGAAHAGKADVRFNKFWASGAHDDVVQARAAALKAIELDPHSSYAYTVLCRMKFTYDWDFAAAEKDCRKAIELDPSSADARHELAMGLVSTGRGAEAVSEIDKAIALSPTSYYKGQKGIILFFLRQYDAAIEQLEQIRETDPKFRHGVHRLVQAYESKSDYENAFRVYLDIWGSNEDDVRRLKYLYSSEGWRGIMKDMLDRGPTTNSRPPQTAAIYCQLGEKDKAFELLAKGFEQRSLWMAHIQMEPRFDPCRDDPRFEELLIKVYGR